MFLQKSSHLYSEGLLALGVGGEGMEVLESDLLGFFVGWVVGVFVARCTEILGGFVDCVCWLNPDFILSKKEGNMRSVLGLPVLANDMSESGM